MNEQAHREYLEDVPREIQDLIYDDARLQAIVRIREGEQLGLKEAKDKLDGIEARMRERFPGRLPDRRPVGCGAGALLILALAAFASL